MRIASTSLLALLVTCQASWGTSLPVVRQFKAPAGAPEGMAFVGSELWVWDVSGPNPSRFYVLDPTTGAVQHVYQGPPSGGITGLTYDGSSLWGVSAQTAYAPFIAQFSTSDGSLIRCSDVPVTNPTGIACDGTSLWISETDGHRLVKLDPTTLAVQKDIFKEPYLTANLTWDGYSLWTIAHERLGTVWTSYLYQMDATTGATIAKYDAPGPGAVGLAFKDKQLYVTDVSNGTIYVLQAPEPTTGLVCIAAIVFFATRKSATKVA